jgi:hypothetical protein
MDITITWKTAWQSKPLLLPRDVGKCRGCNTDRIVGTSWLLHSCTYFQEITATWRSCPYRELRTSGQNNNRVSTLTLSSRQSNSMDNRRTLEAGSLCQERDLLPFTERAHNGAYPEPHKSSPNLPPHFFTSLFLAFASNLRTSKCPKWSTISFTFYSWSVLCILTLSGMLHDSLISSTFTPSP